MRHYLKTCLNVIGITALLYFTPLVMAIVDIHVVKTDVMLRTPWIETAFRTMYPPIFAGECKGVR